MTFRTTWKVLTLALVLAAILSVSVPAQGTACSDVFPRGERPSSPAAVFPGIGTGAIPEATGGPANWAAPLNITFNVTGVSGPMRHVVLNISMTHTYVGDLEVALFSPNAQTANVVFARVGATSLQSFGDNSNLSGTYTFSDFGTANPWTVATDIACGTDCIITPKAYRSTQAGPSTNPAPITSFRTTLGNTLNPNGTWTLRIRDGGGGDTGFVTAASLSIETFYSTAKFDFDGDDKTDIGIFRPTPAEWWINRSSTGSTFAAQFGATTDTIVPADFTGDGKTDIAVWRPSSGQWFVLRSENASFYAFPFGSNGDIPAPADYDDDGLANAAVFRPSTGTWYVLGPGGTYIRQFGAPGDVPVVADYDVDGCADIAIFRPSVGQWWINRSSSGNVLAVQFGASGDKPVPGDYTRDGRSDIAVWRPSNGTWYILRMDETMSFYSVPFGVSGDVPAPGDYDGDGRQDPTVFRPSSSTWFIDRSTAGVLIQQYGAAGDRPVPNAYVP